MDLLVVPKSFLSPTEVATKTNKTSSHPSLQNEHLLPSGVHTTQCGQSREAEERPGEERLGGRGWKGGCPHLLPTCSWLPCRQAPRSRVGPWHEGQARVDMKLGLLSRSSCRRLTCPTKGNGVWGLRADGCWPTVPLVSGGLKDQ